MRWWYIREPKALSSKRIWMHHIARKSRHRARKGRHRARKRACKTIETMMKATEARLNAIEARLHTVEVLITGTWTHGHHIVRGT